MKKHVLSTLFLLITIIVVSCKKENVEKNLQPSFKSQTKLQDLVDPNIIKQGYKFIEKFSSSKFIAYEKDGSTLFVNVNNSNKIINSKSKSTLNSGSVSYKFFANRNILAAVMKPYAPTILDDTGEHHTDLLFNLRGFDSNDVSTYSVGTNFSTKGNQDNNNLWIHPNGEFLIITINYLGGNTEGLIDDAINADPTVSFIRN